MKAVRNTLRLLARVKRKKEIPYQKENMFTACAHKVTFQCESEENKKEKSL